MTWQPQKRTDPRTVPSAHRCALALQSTSSEIFLGALHGAVDHPFTSHTIWPHLARSCCSSTCPAHRGSFFPLHSLAAPLIRCLPNPSADVLAPAFTSAVRPRTCPRRPLRVHSNHAHSSSPTATQLSSRLFPRQPWPANRLRRRRRPTSTDMW